MKKKIFCWKNFEDKILKKFVNFTQSNLFAEGIQHQFGWNIIQARMRTTFNISIPINYYRLNVLLKSYKSFLKQEKTSSNLQEINAGLQVENSFFPRFGRSRNSECLAAKPKANFISKTKLGNTVESMLDATYNNGQHTDATFLNSGNHAVDENIDYEEEEMENQQNDNSICIIRPPILHTDL